MQVSFVQEQKSPSKKDKDNLNPDKSKKTSLYNISKEKNNSSNSNY